MLLRSNILAIKNTMNKADHGYIPLTNKASQSKKNIVQLQPTFICFTAPLLGLRSSTFSLYVTAGTEVDPASDEGAVAA
jgi:hypothetical protein